MSRDNKEKICYIRKGSITAEPNDDELKEPYSLSNRTPFDDRAEVDRFFNYPYAAIEEALANAVYHKAYDERENVTAKYPRKCPRYFRQSNALQCIKGQ